MYIFLSENINSEEYIGVVTKIIDGDSVVIIHDNILMMKIRLSYIDAPRNFSRLWEDSKIFLNNLLLDKIVLVDTNRKDKYGR